MENSSQNLWPGGVPSTLWNYNRQLPGLSENWLPLTDIAINSTLLMNFGIGIVVIWLYAWNRFNKRSYEPTPFDYRVLRELLPSQMRDPLLMQRAYVVYALTLTLVYAVMSFFGGIILAMASTLPTVGPQFSVDPALVGSAQWPLMLAFGMVGLTQLIGPLDHLERSLRRYVHQQLGIPILVKEYTRRFIDLQIRDIQQKDAYPMLREKGGFALRDWAHEEITQTYRVRDVRAKAELSWRMIDGLRAAGWPNAGVRDDTRQSVTRELREAWTSALYLNDLIAAPRQGGAGQAETAEDRPAEAPPKAEAAGAAASPPKSKPAEAGAEVESPPEVQRTRQEQQLVNAVDSMERHLYEMGAIYAIYAQRDREFEGIPDPELRDAVNRVFGRDAYGPSMRQVLCCALVVFFAYLVGLYWTNQDLMTWLPLNIWTASLSALYETLRTLSIYMWPALVAVYATTPNLGPRAAAPPVAGRVLSALIWGGLAGAVLMAMMALLYTWMVARNSDVFIRQMFGQFSEVNTSSNLMYYQSFVPVASLVSAGVVLARLPRSMAGHVVAMCVVAALAVVLAKLREVLLYPTGGCNWPEGRFGLPECLAYNFVDMVTPAVVVLFLCQNAGRDTALPRVPGPLPRAAGVVLLAAALLVPMAGQGRAEEPETVRIGLRADAAPFSYKNTSGGGVQYKGYIADLCFEIFAGSAYRIEVQEVATEDRFRKLNSGPEIDVLCDPVTLRYEDRERWENALFSPVVFASAVTYLRRKNEGEGRGSRTMLLGYVRGTTAEAVVKEHCMVDGAEHCTWPEDNAPPPEACNPAETFTVSGRMKAAAVRAENLRYALSQQGSPGERFAKALRKDDAGAFAADPGGLVWIGLGVQKLFGMGDAQSAQVTYVGCPKASHQELTEWFCSAPMPRKTRFYFGDNEIINRSHSDWVTRNGACLIEPVGPALTYEPYALMTTLDRPVLAQFVQRRIYEIFSDESLSRGVFSASFEGQQMTRPLAYLFLLNGVAGPRRVQQVDCRPGAVDPACAR